MISFSPIFKTASLEVSLSIFLSCMYSFSCKAIGISEGGVHFAIPDMDDENSIVKLHSTCEERGNGDSGRVDKVVDDWSPITGDGRIFLTRPKPYHAFLDEIQKKEAEAQAGASRKAAQMKFLKE